MPQTPASDELIATAAAHLYNAARIAAGSNTLWAWAGDEVKAPFLAQARTLAEAGMLTSPAEVPTLGEIAKQLQPLKDVGVTRDSMLYVIDRVWWQDAGAANQARLAMAELVAADRRDREQA